MSTKHQSLVEIAREYCALIDEAETASDDWLARLAELLPRLHGAVADVSGNPPLMGSTLRPDLEARFDLFSRLHRLLGERDGYWMEFDVGSDGQQMSGSLADDLTDIYCELRHALGKLDASLADEDEALAEFREGYRIHWGQHLVDAERHLYELGARDELRL